MKAIAIGIAILLTCQAFGIISAVARRSRNPFRRHV